MAKKKPNETKVERQDDFADDVMSVINKKFKDKPDVFEFLSDANMVKDWCSTGCTELDLAISNRPDAGLPFSKVIEIYGLNSSSKSLLAAHILTQNQKNGGLSILYDTENAVGMLEFYQAIGLDTTKVLFTDKLRAIEDIFESIESIISRSHLKNSDRPIVVVVDSVMGATTKAEQEADFDAEGFNTRKAIAISKAMRKLPDLLNSRKIMLVLINQLRDNVGAIGFGAEKHKTSGGLSIAFTSSVRLKTTVVKKIKGKINGVDSEIGNVVEVKVIKTRYGPPGKKVQYNLYYESGIDDLGSFLDCVKDIGIIKSSGSQYSFDYINPETAEIEKHTFMRREFEQLIIDRPELKKYLYDKFCDLYIMKYHTDQHYTDVLLEDGDE